MTASSFAFTPGRGSDPTVLDAWAPDADGQLSNLGNVYQRGRYPGTGKWAARRHALGYPDAQGFPTREAAARWLRDHQGPRCTVSLEEDRGGGVRGRGMFWSPCVLEDGHQEQHQTSGGKRWTA